MRREGFEIIARCVILKDNKVLLCNEKGLDFYFLPGGHVEFGELIEGALRREVMEELGVEVEKMEQVDMIENMYEQKGIKRHELNFIFRVKPKTYDFNITEDHLEFSWHDISGLGEINILPNILKEKIIGWIADKAVH